MSHYLAIPARAILSSHLMCFCVLTPVSDEKYTMATQTRLLQRKILSQCGLVGWYGIRRKQAIFLADFNSDAFQEVCARQWRLLMRTFTRHSSDSQVRFCVPVNVWQKRVPTGISRKDSLGLDDDCRMAKNEKLSPCWEYTNVQDPRVTGMPT